MKRRAYSKRGIHECRICKEKFTNKRKLFGHIKSHKNQENMNQYIYTYDGVTETYSCRSCNLEYETQSEVEEHIETHDETFFCKTCNEYFYDPYKYCCHVYSHSKEKVFHCPVCPFKHTARTSIYRHINIIHLKKYIHVCQHCGKGFNDVTLHKEHEEQHVTGKKYTCIVCGKEYPFSAYLNRHQVNYHKVNIDGVLLPNQCNVCSKVFSKTITLQRHMKMHDSNTVREKKHLCDICGKGFAQKDKLTIHYRVHTGDKPYMCSHCDKRFTKKEYLVMHERIHSGEKPYSCDYCGKCFNQRAPLNIHVRSHTGEKPYECHICKTGFSSKGALTLHFNKCLGC